MFWQDSWKYVNPLNLKEALQCSRELYVSLAWEWRCFQWLKLFFLNGLENNGCACCQGSVVGHENEVAESQDVVMGLLGCAGVCWLAHCVCVRKCRCVLVAEASLRYLFCTAGGDVVALGSTCCSSLSFSWCNSYLYNSEIVMRRHLVPNGYLGSLLCFSALLGFSNFWDTWGLSRLLAGKWGAACMLAACLEQPELPCLSCAPAVEESAWDGWWGEQPCCPWCAHHVVRGGVLPMWGQEGVHKPLGWVP